MRRALTLILGVALFGILAAVVVGLPGRRRSGGHDRHGRPKPSSAPRRPRTTPTACATTTARTTGDISGPCDEAEHANDPRCAGQAPATRRRRARRRPERRRHLRPLRRGRARQRPALHRRADRRRPRRRRPRRETAATRTPGRGQRQLRPRQLALRRRATTTAAVTAAVATAATAAVATTTDQPGAPARLPFTPMAGRRTILMVEDETSITEPLAEALDREGFDTRVAGTVADALEQAARARCPTSSSST